jgi:hypothetical protein
VPCTVECLQHAPDAQGFFLCLVPRLLVLPVAQCVYVCVPSVWVLFRALLLPGLCAPGFFCPINSTSNTQFSCAFYYDSTPRMVFCPEGSANASIVAPGNYSFSTTGNTFKEASQQVPCVYYDAVCACVCGGGGCTICTLMLYVCGVCTTMCTLLLYVWVGVWVGGGCSVIFV